MKRTPQTEDIIDEIVTDVSVFFIVLIGTLTVLDYFSLTVLLSGVGVFVIVGIITACLLRISSRLEVPQKEKDPAEPDLDQALDEVRKSPLTNGRKDSVSDLLSQPRYPLSSKPRAQTPVEPQLSKN